MPSGDEALTELLAVPPREFTPQRNALVARLTKDGHAKAAARVKAVPRPTAAVWAVNGLAREDKEAVERLITASERMRAAQLGQKAHGELSAASANYRTALAHLSDRAREMLREANLGASHQILSRIETTLAAAAADPALRSALRHGRIEREQAARGFEVFAGEMPRRPARVTAITQAGRRATGRSAEHDAQVKGAEEALAGTEAEAAARRADLEKARERVKELRTLLKEASRAAHEASGQAEAAATRVRAARTAVRAARRTHARRRQNT